MEGWYTTPSEGLVNPQVISWGGGLELIHDDCFECLIVTKRADPENPLHKKKNTSLYMEANVS